MSTTEDKRDIRERAADFYAAFDALSEVEQLEYIRAARIHGIAFGAGKAEGRMTRVRFFLTREYGPKYAARMFADKDFFEKYQLQEALPRSANEIVPNSQRKSQSGEIRNFANALRDATTLEEIRTNPEAFKASMALAIYGYGVYLIMLGERLTEPPIRIEQWARGKNLPESKRRVEVIQTLGDMIAEQFAEA